MRSGAAVMLALLRRLAWPVAGTSGADPLGQILADAALSRIPGLKQNWRRPAGLRADCAPHQAGREVTAQAYSPIGAGQ
ncbi:hypothetical protein D9599_27155 [Roseomonas sp. KE2513]|nr:hypothetical protein [Roseomonas sp. KE2513]